MKSFHCARQGKYWTAKTVDRLTYSPNKRKNKRVREMRGKLQAKKAPSKQTPVTNLTLKFGSFNINGLDLEAGWAVERLITNRDFDVSIIHL